MRFKALGIACPLAYASLACTAVPHGTASVDSVTIMGTDKLSQSEVEEKLATSPTPKFLGMFRGVLYDYQIFDRGILQRDLERLERFYRARGYYEAHARAGRVRYKSAKHVEIFIEVDEGEPVLIRDVELRGLGQVPLKAKRAVVSAMWDWFKRGKPFEEEPFSKAENAMKRELTDRGYAWAKIERRADVDLATHEAHLSFVAIPGPKATFGAVRIQGLGELPEAPVRRAIDIAPREPYSTISLDRAQRAVLDLGTFGSVEAIPDLKDPPPADAVVPVLVRVEPQRLKAVLVGGGFEIDAIRTEAHLHVGWEHRNLFSGFRHFTVDFKPGGVLYPTRLPTFNKPTAVLPEERLRAELRQPGFIEARTNGVTSHELNAYPVLLSSVVDPKAPVIGYLEYKGALGVERGLWKFFGAPTYNLQWNHPFAYKGTLDPDLRGIVLSYVDLLTKFDYRDDRLRPHKGILVQNDLQFSGIGGDARDVRVQPEVRGYIPIVKKLTLAARASIGFLFPMNYGAAVNSSGAGQPGSSDRAAWVRDIELIYLRGFFSGGPSSNRGYPLRSIAPHGPVPFFNPGLEAKALASSCDLMHPNPSMPYDPIRCAVPIGGLSIWEASLELRFPIHDPLGAGVFCDTSDVSGSRVNLRFDYPHLSCGLGLRYDTPIGPVRLDAGYRIPGAQVPKGSDPRVDGDPGTLYGIPIAFAFGIGEAF